MLLTLLNVILLAGLSFSLFLRLKEKKEDQRLTKGLQLLQNKISILEDLSDRTDEQVHKLVHLIDQKTVEIRSQIHSADQKIEQINIALSKALDISKVFNDQVPHQEVIDRQKTTLYVQAAKLAHQGYSIEQIAAKVDLSPAEIELIAKVNKDQLQFSEEALPSWMNLNMDVPSVKNNSDSELESFAQALNQQNQKMSQSVAATAFDPLAQNLEAQMNLKKEFDRTVKAVPQEFIENTTDSKNQKTIKPFEFRRIIANKVN